MINKYILEKFGVDERVFLEALKCNPSAQGYISGAISEVLLKEYLESKGFEVIRIKEKPSGGNNAKNDKARGDFYIRKNGCQENKWFVIESKGLKSNSEFRGGKLDTSCKVFKFLKTKILKQEKEIIFNKGYKTYLKQKESWEQQNPSQTFPEFKWNRESPGPNCYSLDNLWKDIDDLERWVNSLDKDSFTEDAYRATKGAITILETHQPSKRVGIQTNIKQAAPLVNDFNIMSVDLFLRTGKHEFAFMNSEKISHSPKSPEHLYQNYTIDILVKNKKKVPIIQPPWYNDIEKLISITEPSCGKIDLTQVDNR